MSRLRQARAVADARHLRAAVLVVALQARECARDISDCAGSVTSTIDVPLNSACPVSGLIGWARRRAAVVADVGDIAVALLVDRRLVGAAALQIVVADEPHVLGLGRIADLRLLRQRGRGDHSHHSDNRTCRTERTADQNLESHHVFLPECWFLYASAF